MFSIVYCVYPSGIPNIVACHSTSPILKCWHIVYGRIYNLVCR